MEIRNPVVNYKSQSIKSNPDIHIQAGRQARTLAGMQAEQDPKNCLLT